MKHFKITPNTQHIQNSISLTEWGWRQNKTDCTRCSLPSYSWCILASWRLWKVLTSNFITDPVPQFHSGAFKVSYYILGVFRLCDCNPPMDLSLYPSSQFSWGLAFSLIWTVEVVTAFSHRGPVSGLQSIGVSVSAELRSAFLQAAC